MYEMLFMVVEVSEGIQHRPTGGGSKYTQL